mmetsp:Transcript_34791/g.76524  ORF Transcript_34791/g.76524 Transcript_34791/m.76524 type:complete len:293 (-) Transcript_34791:3492-4370(-)
MPNGAHEAEQPFGDVRRMLDACGGRVDHAGHDDLRVVNQAARHRLLKSSDLVPMARIGGLNQNELCVDSRHVRPDGRRGDVVVVRASVVAPADVDPHLCRRHCGQRRVERSDVHVGDRGELLVAQVGKARVAPHREIGAVDLQHKPARRDRLILWPHRLSESLHKGRMVAVVTVLAEDSERPGRGHRPESSLGRAARRRECLHKRCERISQLGRAARLVRWHAGACCVGARDTLGVECDQPIAAGEALCVGGDVAHVGSARHLAEAGLDQGQPVSRADVLDAREHVGYIVVA